MNKNKLYLTIALLTVVIFFSISAICGQCSITPSEETKIGIDEETGEEKVTSEETEETEETEEETTEEEEETTAEEKIAPTVSLSISEGPTKEGDICYYRVKATVTGKPAPSITWSKDDSSGAWGKTIAQINLTESSPNYTLTATAKNSEGEVTASINLSWGCGPITTEHTAQFHPNVIGTVGPGGFLDMTIVAFGDSLINTDWRGRFAFDVSSLAGKDIVAAELKLSHPDIIGDSAFKGDIVIFYNDFLPLDAGDYFSAAYAGPETFDNDEDPLKFSTGFLEDKIAERASAHVQLQFGIGYENTGSDIDGDAEGRIYTSDDITLTVTYLE